MEGEVLLAPAAIERHCVRDHSPPRRTIANACAGPAYTVQLEVQYKAKIPAGAVLLCTCEVERAEGRKLWMTATMRDGPEGKVYATSRALFVAPGVKKMVPMVTSYLWHRVFGGFGGLWPQEQDRPSQ